MKRTKIDQVVDYTVHKDDESSISGHVLKIIIVLNKIILIILVKEGCSVGM